MSYERCLLEEKLMCVSMIWSSSGGWGRREDCNLLQMGMSAMMGGFMAILWCK